MTSALRATVGLVVISASVISVSYMTSKGRDNEQRYLADSEITSLRGEIKDKDQRVTSLEAQLRQTIADKKDTEESLQKATDYINDKANADLLAVYQKCLDGDLASTTLPADYEKNVNLLLSKSPAVKTYMNEKIPGYKKRVISVPVSNTQTIDFTVSEKEAISIYPSCKTTTTPHANFRYDVVKKTLTEIK